VLVLANIAGLALAWRTQPMSRAALPACQVTLDGGRVGAVCCSLGSDEQHRDLLFYATLARDSWTEPQP